MNSTPPRRGRYGSTRVFADLFTGGAEYSPLCVGSVRLEEAADLDEMIVLAPAGTLERRYVLAMAARALKPGGRLVVMAPKDKGGNRLKAELEPYGDIVSTSSKAHFKTVDVTVTALADTSPDITAGKLAVNPDLGLWTQPGIFSWDRVDPGSALLLEHLPVLTGRGADLGCGIGVLARLVLERSAAVSELHLADIDRRAIDAARKNVEDPRARFYWADVTRQQPDLQDLDFVVMNPPFHAQGFEDRSLGQKFIARAAGMIRKGGVCWLVANRHLPYEAELTARFKSWKPVADKAGFKVIEAKA